MGIRAPAQGPRVGVGILALSISFLPGCGEDGVRPDPLRGEPYATIDVVVRTSGTEFAPGGYGLKVADTPGITASLQDSVTLTVPPGPITLVLQGLPVTCDPVEGTRVPGGSVPWTSAVAAGQFLVVTFEIACTPKDMVFARVSATNWHELYRMNADGSGVVQLTFGAGPVIWSPRWSPDGTRIAFASDAWSSANVEIFVVEAGGGDPKRLCCGGDPRAFEYDLDPAWSPDGASIAWAAIRSDSLGRGIYRMDAEGGEPTQLSAGRDAHPDWGRDGRILFTRRLHDGPNGQALYVMGPFGESPTLLVEGVEGAGAWSPDGRSVVFTRYDEDVGRTAVWTVRGDGGTARERAREVSLTQPRWSPDGTELVAHFSTDADPLLSVRGICVTPVEGARCAPLTSGGPRSAVDVSPDWRRR